MTDTKDIVKKIAALRVRLDKAQGILEEAGTAAQALVDPAADAKLERRLQVGAWHNTLIDGALRTLTDPAQGGDTPVLPEKLIARGARLLKHTRDLLQALRQTADDPALPEGPEAPLAVCHRETAALVDNVLRTVQVFPPAPSAQLRLCQGLELVLQSAQQRMAFLQVALERRRVELGRMDCLAHAFESLSDGQTVPRADFYAIAEQLLAEAQQRLPIHAWEESPAVPARFAAAHGYNVAQVLARVLEDDGRSLPRRTEAIVAALVHDVGMAGLAPDLLAHPGPWDEEQRRALERHCHLGGSWAATVWPAGSLPVQAASDHHERMDGTGYPAGKSGMQIEPLVRLVTACDVYVALTSPRPHRPALDPRTALTDMLLLADRGVLDKHEADKVLRLGFYPVGSIVELDNGALAQVMQRNRAHPAQPLVALLTGPKRQPHLSARLLDLSQDTERSILRLAAEKDRRTFPNNLLHHRCA